jgi:Fe-S-cluster containining protein
LAHIFLKVFLQLLILAPSFTLIPPMSIGRKARSVEALFRRLDHQIAAFQAQTTLHCLSGCGRCCTKPDIRASALEFLPLAYHLYREGKAAHTWTWLKAHPQDLCLLFQPLSPASEQGFCSDYPHRGLICRLFGFSAMRDKHGGSQLYTCRLIKEDQPLAVSLTHTRLGQGLPIPIVSQYYQRLSSIDADLAKAEFPVNVAISKALETVMHYYAYRPKPRGFRQAG